MQRAVLHHGFLATGLIHLWRGKFNTIWARIGAVPLWLWRRFDLDGISLPSSFGYHTSPFSENLGALDDDISHLRLDLINSGFAAPITAARGNVRLRVRGTWAKRLLSPASGRMTALVIDNLQWLETGCVNARCSGASG
jgi:hypothetical protein